MCDPNKIFVGKLHRWVQRDDLVDWMWSKSPGLCPSDIFVLDPPVDETALKSAFVTYRRAPHKIAQGHFTKDNSSKGITI
jgi:hypothetical protein